MIYLPTGTQMSLQIQFHLKMLFDSNVIFMTANYWSNTEKQIQLNTPYLSSIDKSNNWATCSISYLQEMLVGIE